jgi:uncharacterized protein YneF (UPF0154 family)
MVKILIIATVLLLVGMCIGPFVGFNQLPKEGDDENS